MYSFLNELHAWRAKLDALGVQINDDDYWSTIIQSLPWSLASFASGQITAIQLCGESIDPEILIITLCDESS